ncbi:penicillin-insensitive murein endopeptidase [Rhodomicrobium vannielii ATCC 17100]|uniref:penicillin-insensitive murein endopeptidase n=1 Tax=Rhodomicrobium vannielii TaxID=1069 RepID=UPI00191A69F0|nr:penicillin-insensitive murein endopeptidase [Rhodomicrobium vannielii]MBJ7535986.1 penicillin-insensitive murein endopeptidase [Rhodomicrobium vannielii ATCC 17100]
MKVQNFLLNASLVTSVALAVTVASGGADALAGLAAASSSDTSKSTSTYNPRRGTPKHAVTAQAQSAETRGAAASTAPMAETGTAPSVAQPAPTTNAPVAIPVKAAATAAPGVRLAAGATPAATPLPIPGSGPIPPKILKATPAKLLFGAAREPAKMETRSVGFYAKGCLAGAAQLPENGPVWQGMRLSRNRHWGNPVLVTFIEKFAKDAKAKDGWPGLLIGDMSMPRGGPMPFGHASHQVGLDVDIWYKPMPGRTLAADEREQMKMDSVLLDPVHVNEQSWTPDHVKLLRRAVSYPEVTRVFVNPAIKKWMCDNVTDDRGFLHKIQPIMGHDAHFHVRLACPAGDEGCRNQPPLPAGDGCGGGLDKWIAKLSKPVVPVAPKPKVASAPAKPKAGVTMAQLPPACAAVLNAPSITLAAH